MPSFDVVSKMDWAEFGNALLQAQKEIGQRFDFRNTETSLEKNEEGIDYDYRYRESTPVTSFPIFPTIGVRGTW